jgi:CRISPR system Cascade subunit CasB
MAEKIGIDSFVRKKIAALDEESSWSRAMLAKLRRGTGKIPGSIPEIWEITIGDSPDDWQSRDGTPSYAENAVHAALTLYALHRQGKGEIANDNARDENGNSSGKSFGSAVARLISPDRSNEQAVKRRFDAVATASDFKELTHHARGLIQLLKANNITMDYPRFARDLHFYQIPGYADKVRLRWGEDFYRVRRDNGDKTENEGE